MKRISPPSTIVFALFLFYFGVQSASAAKPIPPPSSLCRDEIQIAQESGKIVVDFTFYPMMTIDKKPIRCNVAGRRSSYYWANECQLKMRNCGAFVVYKTDSDKVLQVCYYDTNSEDDLVDASSNWDESYKPPEGMFSCLGAYVSKNPIRGM